jgi:hypothetical protein
MTISISQIHPVFVGEVSGFHSMVSTREASMTKPVTMQVFSDYV